MFMYILKRNRNRKSLLHVAIQNSTKETQNTKDVIVIHHRSYALKYIDCGPFYLFLQRLVSHRLLRDKGKGVITYSRVRHDGLARYSIKMAYLVSINNEYKEM